jgi:hypothetical protein
MNARIAKIVESPAFIPVLVGILSFGAGATGGYILGRRTITETKRREFTVTQIDQETMDSLHISEDEEGEENLEEDVVVTIQEVPLEPKGTIVVDEDKDIYDVIKPHILPAEPPVQHNVFAHDGDDWDYEVEEEHRTETKPYVLHRDEFYSNEKDYTQTTLTYYEGDNIMVDEEDVPVYNHEDVVGPLLWGHGSQDPLVFHVRNDRLESEFEVLHERGFYSVEVLGIEMEASEDAQAEKHLKHSTDHVKRFRTDD